MFTASKITECGENELQDRADFFEYRSGLVIALADGVGGMSGGAEAADFFVERIKKAMHENTLNIEHFKEFIETSDQEMANAGNLGETTCVIVALSENKILGASVGDSEVWLIKSNGIENLTSRQIRKPFVGSGEAIATEFKCGQFTGTLLVASDGLLKYASSEKIAETAKQTDLDLATKNLVGLVRYPSGRLPDDVSIVLARAK